MTKIELSTKSPEMENLLEKTFGRTTAIHKSQCVWCKKPVDPNKFRDKLSRKEYTISGMCQKCQDEVFGK